MYKQNVGNSGQEIFFLFFQYPFNKGGLIAFSVLTQSYYIP